MMLNVLVMNKVLAAVSESVLRLQHTHDSPCQEFRPCEFVSHTHAHMSSTEKQKNTAHLDEHLLLLELLGHV